MAESTGAAAAPAKAHESNRPKLYTLGELLTASFPPQRLLITNGILPICGIMVLGGPPKAYKSFTLGTIIYHLATGTNLFGAHRKPHGRVEKWANVTKPCRILLLEQEIGAAHLQSRYQALFERLTDSERELMKSNIFTYSCDPELMLNNTTGVNKLRSLIERTNPDVVCFDPLVEFHNCNENDTQQMAGMLRNLDSLRWKYSFASIITHHIGKSREDQGRYGPDQLRGNSVIFAKGDSYLMLSPRSRTQGTVAIDFTLRHDLQPDVMEIVLDWEDLRAKFVRWGSDKKANLPAGLVDLGSNRTQ